MRILLLPALAALLAACASDPVQEPVAGQRYAIIETGASRKAEGIFPVLLTRIDDKRITVTADDLRRGRQGHFPNARSVFRVAPGQHSLEAMGMVDRRYVPGLSQDLSRDNSEPLVANFQSGTRYFVGIKADSARRAEWRLVIWKTEAVDEGAIDIID
ncbi:MAG: hypothetical protein AAGE01_19940 [Pseudomonadota bacterium]